MKHIGKHGKYLYPVRQLSIKFRGKCMAGINKQLAKKGKLSQNKAAIKKALQTPWVVFCEPSLGEPDHVIGYLGQYAKKDFLSP